MNCCAGCFGDRGLQNEIFPNIKPSTLGNCDYCGSLGVVVVAPILLRDNFESVIAIYEQHPQGKTLPALLQKDWLMFPRMDEANAARLLADILDDGNIVRQQYRAKVEDNAQELSAWNTLREELKYKNRFFPTSSINSERLENLLAYIFVKPDELDATWFRARIQEEDIPFRPEQMGAPPKRIASHGRANPSGIPYLYVASDAQTAVSEIRPHTGEKASVMGFRLNDALKMVDLRNPRKHVSPFVVEGETEIALLRSDIGFLEHLGSELMRPILPKGAAIDYIPTQFLCELIKKCGYDGVVYKSSVGQGINLALFDPAKATPSTDVSQHAVSRVSVDITPA